MLISPTSCRGRIMMPVSFTEAIPSDILAIFLTRQFCGAPPERIRGCAEKNDSETNPGANRLRCYRVGNQGRCRQNEDDRSPRISGHAIRPRSVGGSFAVGKDAGRGKPIKYPADKNNIS